MCIHLFILSSYCYHHSDSSFIKETLPTIETCFNCSGTRSSDAKKNKKTTKPPRKFISYATILIPPPPWRERGSLQDGASAWRRNFFAHHTRPVGKKLYSLLIVSIWNNLNRYTTGYRSGPMQQVRYLTDTQSINQLLMTCQCTKIIQCKGREKKGDFSPTDS